MRNWRVGVAVALGLGVAVPAMAQERRIEVSATGGYTLAGGFGVDPRTAGGKVYDQVVLKDGVSYGATIGFFTSERLSLEFAFSQAQSNFGASGPNQPKTEFVDMKISNYHGNFLYHFTDEDNKARPYFLFGLGATSFGFSDFTPPGGGATRQINGSTYFSGQIGLGVKYFFSDAVGLKVQGRFTPTYVGSSEEGYWCDPYWGCWTVGDSKYATQTDLSAGLVFRF